MLKYKNSKKSKALRAAVLANYTGDPQQTLRALKLDGFECTLQVLNEIVADPRVQSALKHNAAENDTGYDRTRLQAFWRGMMDNPLVRHAEKLKASELYGKSIAAFTDKVEHSGAIAIGIAAILDKDLQARRAEKAAQPA